MDCRQFRQEWEPDVECAESARGPNHAAVCAACRQWLAEQAAVDRLLRSALRAAVEGPVAPDVGIRLQAQWRRHLEPSGVNQAEAPPPVPAAWSVLLDRIGYAVASGLTAAAMLALALKPPM